MFSKLNFFFFSFTNGKPRNKSPKLKIKGDLQVSRHIEKIPSREKYFLKKETERDKNY